MQSATIHELSCPRRSKANPNGRIVKLDRQGRRRAQEVNSDGSALSVKNPERVGVNYQTGGSNETGKQRLGSANRVH